jgi:hypothetical protein
MGHNDLRSRKKLKIVDFNVFENAVKASINQIDEKYMVINVGQADLNDVVDWWKNHVAKYVL